METTSDLRGKSRFDTAELHEIHIITYSLEKAIAYFVENSEAEQKVQAGKMAEVVELIHIGSENGRAEETQEQLTAYLELADGFADNAR